MRIILSILLLTATWLLLTVRFNVSNFFIGLFLSALIVLIILFKTKKNAAEKLKTTKPLKIYFKKISALISLTLFFFKESFIASFKVSYDILVKGKNIEPSIIGVEIATSSETELIILSNLISITPGNLTLDFEEDKGLIFVYIINGNREESFRKSSAFMDKRIKTLLG